ncbi:MAG: hypothetical protein K0R54_1632 [Clostridiaceae bacterium]|nr:hypothetical protein [Clostridiaceae bacterium]
MIHDFPDEITPDQTQIIMDETRITQVLYNLLINAINYEVESQVGIGKGSTFWFQVKIDHLS